MEIFSTILLLSMLPNRTFEEVDLRSLGRGSRALHVSLSLSIGGATTAGHLGRGDASLAGGPPGTTHPPCRSTRVCDGDGQVCEHWGVRDGGIRSFNEWSDGATRQTTSASASGPSRLYSCRPPTSWTTSRTPSAVWHHTPPSEPAGGSWRGGGRHSDPP